MPEFRNRRQISGQRVVCKCSLVLPKVDSFLNIKTARKGYMVANVRGGSLYLAQQFTDATIGKIFIPDKPAPLKKFTLYPDDAQPIVIGDINVRYIRLVKRQKIVGMVLRFVGPNEKQMDKLIDLPLQFPAAAEDEETSIPIEELYRMR